MITIKIKDLTKKYKDCLAVNNLNLEINEKELFSLLGVNGSGKTTTIRMLSGLILPTSGDAILLEKSINTDINEIKTFINVSPQETAIAPNLSVRENLEFIAGVYGVSNSNIKEKVDNVIKEFSLEKIEDKKASKLSGGWQRRLSIAMSIITEPKILFLDEPTLGLDVLARRELWEVIRNLKKKTTIILTTHYMEEAEMLSDRIGIMKEGSIIQIGTPEELIEITETKNFEDAFVKIIEQGGIK